MTTYELALSIDTPTRQRMVAAGILPYSLERHIYIYEQFTRCLASGMSKMDAYIFVGEKTFTSDENVRKIVAKMQKEVK